MNNISSSEWEHITAKQNLFWNMTNGEVVLGVKLTSRKLRVNDKAETDIIKMNMIVSCLFAVTQAPRKGGVLHAFDKQSDDLYPAPNLGRFGLEHWRFKELFNH
eukprot:6736497-Ditylum_brightwellii.AAC.1